MRDFLTIQSATSSRTLSIQPSLRVKNPVQSAAVSAIDDLCLAKCAAEPATCAK